MVTAEFVLAFLVVLLAGYCLLATLHQYRINREMFVLLKACGQVTDLLMERIRQVEARIVNRHD